MVAPKEQDLLRQDVGRNGNILTPEERENLLKPYLPSPRIVPSDQVQHSRPKKPVRTVIKTQLYLLVYTVIHTLFSVYIRIRQTYHAIADRIYAILYYHHHTPELILKDVKGLSRIPQHLSVILELKEENKGGSGIEGLVDDLSEIAAWCASARIPMLSVYEKTGVLKNYVPTTHRAITQKFRSYFGHHRPSLQIRAPNQPSYLNGDVFDESASSSPDSPGHLSLLLLSADDGRATLVDLTKTLTEMSQKQKLSPSDISSELVDTEVSESVMGEPDLLLLFGSIIQLQGYPPWQVRLAEIL
ncbi:MAG: hypothetical protein M1834_004325 [Cirrosporium novae-zelandiae]|nr:MAG: hypothetical protein M1834_004325 [Cirrosporium novae-zelandiae]